MVQQQQQRQKKQHYLLLHQVANIPALFRASSSDHKYSLDLPLFFFFFLPRLI